MNRKILAVVLAVLLLIPVSSAGLFNDRLEEKCKKDYLGVEVFVQEQLIYINECYTILLTKKIGSPQQVPTIAVLSTPINVRMTAKIPVGSGFKPMLKADNTEPCFEGSLIKSEGGFNFLEYTLCESGLWNFILDSPYDTDRYSFTLSSVQYIDTPGVVPGNSDVFKPLVQINLLEDTYKEGDRISFDTLSPDWNNPKVYMLYYNSKGIMDNLPVNTPIYANSDKKQIVFVDSSGVKDPKTVTLLIEESGSIAYMKANWWKGVLIALVFLVVGWKIKKG